MTLNQITDRIYRGDTTKEELIEILDYIHSRLQDPYYEDAPSRQEQEALDALKKATLLINFSTLN